MSSPKPKTVAVLGATGAVGREMLRTLEHRGFPIKELRPLASPRSAGTRLPFRGEEIRVEPVQPEHFDGVDIALFSAGGATSRQWAPIAAERGAIVIDNSSAWRMHDDVPLVVPEVNGAAAQQAPKNIIANPNCSTIQLVVALKPLHDEAELRRIVVATYQAISGGGQSALDVFRAQSRAWITGEAVDTEALDGQLAGNVLMHWARDTASGYQEEELKLVRESRKILGLPELAVSPTVVRVPVETGHAEAVTAEFTRPITPERARELLEAAPGVEVRDDFEAGVYPQPIQAAGTDPVWVGRIRSDIGARPGAGGGLCLWVVADNLRKGAALNAVQIAETLTA